MTILQSMKYLTDRQAADAVRTRLDWKYILRLEFIDPGRDLTVLSEFCSRLGEHQAEQWLLDVLLQRCRNEG
jgi:transposase